MAVFPPPLVLGLAWCRLITAIYTEIKVATLECFKLGGAGLNSEFFGDDSPATTLVRLVDPHYRVRVLICHLTELEDHKRVGRGADLAQHEPDLGFGDAKLGGHFRRESIHIRTGLNVHVAEKGIKAARGHCGSFEHYEQEHYRQKVFHGTSFR